MTNNREQFRTGVIKPVECFKEGWELIKDRYWLFFAITLVGFFLGGLVPFFIIMGALMCGIGAYFVLPLIFADTYIAYRKIFPKPTSRNFDPPPPNAYQNL